MNNEFIHFEKISRKTWQNLHRKTTPPLTQKELNSIKSFNDKISLQDVTDVYLPLTNLIQIYKRSKEDLAFSKGIFLQKAIKRQPFIIGVSGSVAVGKSTTSRLLQILLSRTFSNATVELVTTDGFLYPNAHLQDQNLLKRKGFPESYNMGLLLDFLDNIKNGKDYQIPVYSHEIYDIVPDEKQYVTAADFVIVEGINVFQNPQNERLYMTDFFDFSIYVDAEVENIETWYLDRFKKLLTLAKEEPTNYYHPFTSQPENKVMEFAQNVWKSINLVNLQDYIEPTRNRAEIILHKTENHEIDEIYLKK
ncbi:type I pantothenate kinase [Streptococcus constellatus subsp. pharyngis]|uniref:Pantothenate kinase n=1 Tax=Streptococcus constellatus subsp. pharyngis SK1060 = CCUG 46377 TaxID=1035184 RepID=F9P6E4_STRCV|nr:type I pantothenate kinase [Streptococcus constellatus]AGU72771.1 pantothenate kinase [Streptococcus constellatus subsp. pharyngis C232]AGU74527.1 pantothenate kinase [Streptococcus constellatus subsp. pharyngis C818]AGU79944.1 pantothenate kinase [Streptococcus constellatus subsp. pharyngis C1050]EGV09325.1 pantothenate kinase [Streptococcus constellatus subsp. pharyngis SK1060 = CCUG 46377]QRP82198.1 type I pantothenate kinase [Streptococcus constellatus]